MNSSITKPMPAPREPDQLLRQAVHDLRSPLSAIKVVAVKIGVEQESCARLLDSAVQRMEEILVGLSDSLSPTVNSLTSEALVDLVNSVVEEKRFLHPEVHFEFERHAFDEHVLAIPEKLTRAISNLLDNAIEAYEDTLRNKRIALSLFRDETGVCLTIVDNGRGIPPRVLARLEHTGFSFGKRDSDSGHRGLGLTYAREALKEVGGNLKFSSLLGHGTEISLHLPVNC